MPCGLRIHVKYMFFTQYAIENDMKPVEHMKEENFTENRGKSRP